jgi:hypothetical protein
MPLGTESSFQLWAKEKGWPRMAIGSGTWTRSRHVIRDSKLDPKCDLSAARCGRWFQFQFCRNFAGGGGGAAADPLTQARSRHHAGIIALSVECRRRIRSLHFFSPRLCTGSEQSREASQWIERQEHKLIETAVDGTEVVKSVINQDIKDRLADAEGIVERQRDLVRNRRSRSPTSELGVGPLSLPRPRDGKCCPGARPRPPIEAGRRPRVRAASRAAGGARARKKKGGSDHGTGLRQWRRRATGPAAGSCGARWRWGQGRRGRGAWGA